MLSILDGHHVSRQRVVSGRERRDSSLFIVLSALAWGAGFGWLELTDLSIGARHSHDNAPSPSLVLFLLYACHSLVVLVCSTFLPP